MYLIPFLHQTTTHIDHCGKPICCILFHFYIKPQLLCSRKTPRRCCILFHFYIKPQHKIMASVKELSCILFHFYIKPQHKQTRFTAFPSCILFHFYIKPQHGTIYLLHYSVVSYSISTSNHNNVCFNLSP